MPRRSTLRASDADRDGVTERLRKAATEGRLTTEELDERLSAALRAKTYGELDPLLADLPTRNAPAKRRNTGRKLDISHPVTATVVGVAAITVAMAAVAIVAMIGAAWLAWCVFAWIFFGARRHRHRHWARRAPTRGSSRYVARVGSQGSYRGSWF
jgi:hypothetical protein